MVSLSSVDELETETREKRYRSIPAAINNAPGIRKNRKAVGVDHNRLTSSMINPSETIMLEI